MRWAVAAIAVLGLGGCATMPEGEPVADASAEASQAEVAADEGSDAGAGGDELICKRVRVTGSNFRQRVCGTAEQWGYSQEQSEQGVIYLEKNRRAQSAFDN